MFENTVQTNQQGFGFNRGGAQNLSRFSALSRQPVSGGAALIGVAGEPGLYYVLSLSEQVQLTPPERARLEEAARAWAREQGYISEPELETTIVETAIEFAEGDGE